MDYFQGRQNPNGTVMLARNSRDELPRGSFTLTYPVDAAYARVLAAAKAHTPQGAQSFAEFYVDQISRAWTIPDPSMVAGYGLSTCKSCGAYEGTARSLRDDGQRYAGEPVSRLAGAWQPGATAARVEVPTNCSAI